jgi:ankyrin repeat protein
MPRASRTSRKARLTAPSAGPQAEDPILPHILIYGAYAGYAAEVDAQLYGLCNRALWEDDDLHAAVLGVHHGARKRARLMAAARAGDSDRLTRLLRMLSGSLRGLTNVNGADFVGRTALHWAADKGHTSAVQVLLGAGAAVDASTGRGSTALMWAADKGHVSTVKALLVGGASIEAANAGGWTALH